VVIFVHLGAGVSGDRIAERGAGSAVVALAKASMTSCLGWMEFGISVTSDIVSASGLGSDRSKIVEFPRGDGETTIVGPPADSEGKLGGGGKNPAPEIALACIFAPDLVVLGGTGLVEIEGDCGADGAGRAARDKSAASSLFDLRSLISVSEDTSSGKPLG